MTARAYLSIGDVLTLLREEFPDVTISKIRFLESQGLVNPERSPSGYRKFYEQDVERLRWVLRQQREHFLPLRVIRDRLMRAGNGVPPDEPVASGAVGTAAPGATEDDGSRRARSEAGRAPVAARVAGTMMATRTAPEGTGNGAGVHGPEPEPVLGPGRSAPEPAEPAESPEPAEPAKSPEPPQGTGGEAGSASSDERSSGGERSGTGWRATAQSDDEEPDEAPAGSQGDHAPGLRSTATEPGPAHAAPGPVTEPADHPPAHAAASPAPPEEPAGEAAAARTPVTAAPVPPGGGPEGGTSLTLAELCETSGLSPADVAALETFGLIETVSVAGATYYDDDAVTVANLAAELGRYGIEPRHLRVYRNAVEREVGLVEQVVMPLLRQRNPAARKRAVDAAAELTRLGEGLRASLLRRELRRQLGT